MPSFTIETTYRLPVFRQRTYEAPTLNEACRRALDDHDWTGQQEDHECAGASYITGAWPGVDTAYRGPALAVPASYAAPIDEPRHSLRTACYTVGVAFLSEDAPFAFEDYAVVANGFASAEAKALGLAEQSVYFNERIPGLTCAVRASEEMIGDPDDILLLDAHAALSSCVGDLEAWATCGPEGFSSDEAKRRDGYDAILARIARRLGSLKGPIFRTPHKRFDPAFTSPEYGLPGAPATENATYCVLVTIFSDDDAVMRELYEIEAPSAVQAENRAIDRSDYSPHWRSTFDGMSRSAFASPGLPRSKS
jgi:hypothetical protein